MMRVLAGRADAGPGPRRRNRVPLGVRQVSSHVTSITVDYTGDASSTLTLGNRNNGGDMPWTFQVPITLTGDSTDNSTILETQATSGSHTWTLGGSYGGNIDGTAAGAVTFTNVGTLLPLTRLQPIPWSVKTSPRPGPWAPRPRPAPTRTAPPVVAPPPPTRSRSLVSRPFKAG